MTAAPDRDVPERTSAAVGTEAARAAKLLPHVTAQDGTDMSWREFFVRLGDGSLHSVTLRRS